MTCSLVTKKRIGIFSGTFDPVHEGHVQFVLACMEVARLDEVSVVVDRSPIAKQPLASFNDRYAMAKRALNDERAITVRLSASSTTSFNDIAELLDGNEVFLLVGSDLVAKMKNWHEFMDMSPRIAVIAGLRKNDSQKAIAEILRSYHLRRNIIIDSPSPYSTSSRSRNDTKVFLPAITDYINEHRLYDSSLV